MKRIIALLGLLGILLSGCGYQNDPADIAATTLPVYEFTSLLCRGTGLRVTRLVTEGVSCLHDYALNVNQVRAVESATLVVISGAGLEVFMGDLLTGKHTLDAGAGIPLLESCQDHEDHHDHSHDADPHIWLSPENARIMAQNICAGLIAQYPRHKAVFEENLAALLQDIDDLILYGQQQLSRLSGKQIITFHDGFSYLADHYGLEIVKAMEEEYGSCASAAELKQIIDLVRDQKISAIFTETNGSTSAAGIIAAETGVPIYALDMAMSGESWFAAMYHNIDILKEALG